MGQHTHKLSKQQWRGESFCRVMSEGFVTGRLLWVCYCFHLLNWSTEEYRATDPCGACAEKTNIITASPIQSNHTMSSSGERPFCQFQKHMCTLKSTGLDQIPRKKAYGMLLNVSLEFWVCKWPHKSIPDKDGGKWGGIMLILNLK